MESCISLVVVFCWFVALAGHINAVGAVKVGQDGKMTFKTPNITDEEAHSNFLPEQLKCDACRIVAYQLHLKFKTFNEMHRHYNYNLPESEIIDIIDDVCNNKDTFNTYGIKEVKGINRLSGAGLETKDSPGLLSGGGKWPGRLMNMCSSFVEEIGEEDLYATYRRDLSDVTALEKALCKGSGIFGECNKIQQRPEL